jgi:hypothetical protein
MAGLAMLVLPGPGLLVTAIGLGLLALEFEWAERLLVRALHEAERARVRARRASLSSAVRTGAGCPSSTDPSRNQLDMLGSAKMNAMLTGSVPVFRRLTRVLCGM